MGRRQFQMVALGRVGHRSARQKSAPEKGSAAVLFLQNSKIDMVGQRFARVIAKGGADSGELVPVLQDKDLLPPFPLGQAVEAHLERLSEEGWKAAGKCLRLSDDPGPAGRKTGTEQQYAIGLSLGTAAAGQLPPAELSLGLGCKGHGRPSFY